MSALHIHERLAKANPDAFETYLASTQNNLGVLYLSTLRFAESEAMYISALKTNPINHLACTNLAASLLFQGKIEEAEKIYRQYKAEYKELFLDSFAIYEQLGVIPEERKADVERIKAMLRRLNFSSVFKQFVQIFANLLIFWSLTYCLFQI